MKKITDQDPEPKSLDLVAENIARLKALFPEIVTEGPSGSAINVDVLKALVGDATVTDAEEKYGLNWHGKRRARQLALTPSLGTLRPCPEESVDWDTTQNLMIEGDNLEVLKLLQKSYAGKVKLIYIDPPYNTGNDFVYRDDFRDTIAGYLEITGQVGSGGEWLTSNTEASGRFHTDWLNMMYPRLKLARALLEDDGLILISIDDNELMNIWKMCEEVFGAERFVANFKWNKTSKAPTLSNKIRGKYEYVLCFSKGEVKKLQGPASYNTMAPLFNIGNPVKPIAFPAGSIRCLFEDGRYQKGVYGTGDKAVTLLDDMEVRDQLNANGVTIEARFKWAQGTVDRAVKSGQMFAFKKPSFTTMYYYLDGKDDDGGDKFIAPSDIINMDECGVERNDEGYVEAQQIFGGVSVFDYCKPSSLIKYLCSFIPSKDFVILDFFAGSGTTGQAVMELNSEDGGSRRYILVQLPEICSEDSAAHRGGYKVVSEITKDRLRRVGKCIAMNHAMLAGDTGFRVFKLASTNIREWSPDRDNIPDSLDASIEHLKTDRTEADILYEVLLKLGLDLCVPIVKRTLAGKDVHSVGGGVLIACLATRIARADVEALGLGIVAWRKELATAGETTCLFRDSAFEDDVAKTNLAAILEQNGITTVRSL